MMPVASPDAKMVAKRRDCKWVHNDIAHDLGNLRIPQDACQKYSECNHSAYDLLTSVNGADTFSTIAQAITSIDLLKATVQKASLRSIRLIEAFAFQDMDYKFP